MRTPLPPRTPQPERRKNIAMAWAMVGGVFAIGVCCGTVGTVAAFLYHLSS